MTSSTTVSDWPSRIPMRRSGIIDLTATVGPNSLGIGQNWVPLRIKSKVRLEMADALFYRVEVSGNGSVAATGTFKSLIHCAIAFSVQA